MHVRVHVFFLLFAFIAINLAVRASFAGAEPIVGYAVAGILILLASVLAHEFGHCIAAWKVGGAADQILIWPLGGLTHVNITQDPAQERVTAIAGPLVNLVICLMALPVLLTADPQRAWEVFNPLAPPAPERLTWLATARLVFYTNWVLVLVNLLPAFPLDGGRFLRAVLWPRTGFRYAVISVAQAAKLTAAAVCLLAVGLHWTPYAFASLPLVLLGVFLYFSARQDLERLHEYEAEEGSFGYDFSQGYTSLEKTSRPHARHGLFASVRQWLDHRRAERLTRQKQVWDDEERRVDEVLARLYELGPESLSHDDRALLERVSARYRNRLQQ